MATLALLRPPPSMRSGDDVLGEKTAAGLTAAGLSAELHELWPEWWAARLWHSSFPGRRRLFEKFPARWSLRDLAFRIADCRAVWINGCSLPNDSSCSFEKERIAAGQDTIFQLQDDWFSIPGARARAEACTRTARLVVVPTRALCERIHSLIPTATVLTLEEPIDVHRFAGVPNPADGPPFLVWTGNPHNLKEIPGLADILQMLYRQTVFTLRVISGHRRPVFDIGIPWEWHPYSQAAEGYLLAGAVAGIAPMADTLYARCKGSYKVKTYLAAGIPVVASPIGHQADMICQGVTGFLPASDAEWFDYLLLLLRDRALGAQMGRNARQFAIGNFSHEVLMPNWAEELNATLGYFA